MSEPTTEAGRPKMRLTGEMLDMLATEFPASNAAAFACDWDEYQDFVEARASQPLTLYVERDRQRLWDERVAARGWGANRSSAYRLGWEAGFGDAIGDAEAPTATADAT